MNVNNEKLDKSYARLAGLDLPNCHILDIFVGETKTLVDSQGEWQSSIARDRVDGLARLAIQGFEGDKATQPYHGSLNLAVCIHSQKHYDYWNTTLDMKLKPGGVGENITLDTWDDSNICVGDILRIGNAQIQISAPRMPCENQARFIGRTDWIKRTIKGVANRYYMLACFSQAPCRLGIVSISESRLNHDLTIQALNACWYHNFDVELAERFIAADGLMDGWKKGLQKKIDKI